MPGTGQVNELAGSFRQVRVDRLPHQAVAEQQGASLTAEHPRLDCLIRRLGDRPGGYAVEEIRHLVNGQRLTVHRSQPDKLDRPCGQGLQLPAHRAHELSRHASRVATARLRLQ